MGDFFVQWHSIVNQSLPDTERERDRKEMSKNDSIRRHVSQRVGVGFLREKETAIIGLLQAWRTSASGGNYSLFIFVK